MPVGTSWGRWPRYEQRIVPLTNRFEPLPLAGPMLAFGNGRSYGDVCLNEGGTLLATRGLDRFIRFDAASGILECEAGVLLSEIIALTLPHGWFPPVTPGTALVSVGGAVAVCAAVRSMTARAAAAVVEVSAQHVSGWCCSTLSYRDARGSHDKKGDGKNPLHG